MLLTLGLGSSSGHTGVTKARRGAGTVPVNRQWLLGAGSVKGWGVCGAGVSLLWDGVCGGTR